MNQERQGTESGRKSTKKRAKWPILVMGTVSAVLIAGIAIQMVRPQPGQAVDRETARKLVEESKATALDLSTNPGETGSPTASRH